MPYTPPVREIITALLLVTGTAAEPGAAGRLRALHGWPVLPEGTILGQVSGLGVDSHGDVFVFQSRQASLDGRPLEGWAHTGGDGRRF